MRLRFVLFFVYTTLLSFGQSKEEDVFHLYLIGDAGAPKPENLPYRSLLRDQLSNETSPSAIVFLGDNIYPKGLPAVGERGREKAESILEAQIDLVNVNDFPIYFVPGNHDWQKGGPHGWNYVGNQQAWIDSLHNQNIQLYPKGGCPGPEEINLNDKLTLIIIDTQWFLHPWDKPEGDISLCESKTLADVLAELDDLLRRNSGKQVVIAAHHPIISYGEHGGFFTWKDHLFPLYKTARWLYLPLPVVGSIYPMYRKIFGNIQDIPNPNYKLWSKELMKLLEQYPGMIYAAGHEHALQYSVKDSVHYVVSGSGSKSTKVKKKGFAQFAASQRGYAIVKISKSGSVSVDYYSYDEVKKSTDNSFSKKLGQIELPKIKNANASKLIEEGTVSVKASERYRASGLHTKLLGENYRDVWEQEISVPVFDIGKEKGGLKIIKRGGGLQTLSLRLQDSLGNEYTLRSIEKFPEKAVPEVLRKTFAQDLVQDQISASNPYGALIVPFLAEAAGVYHANPKIVYLPDDPRLGEYQQDFGNQLMLFEERPSGSGKGMDFFGNADKIVSTDKVLEKIKEDNDNNVDQEFALHSRLFDLWIGDWDRHEDQWRWAQFDNGKGELFRPIPRDRDQAFFVNQGVIPKLASRRWVQPRFQGFDKEIRWVPGFMFNGRYFDRSFLNALSRESWIAGAKELQSKMTDEVIEASVRQWPNEIFDLHGQEIINKLKARRPGLVKYALDHYEFLAREVDVVGSSKKEWFKVTILPGGNVRVEMMKSKNKNSAQLLYSREFLPGETDEIRLFGRGGDDDFDFEGDGKTSIRIRVIGGDGEDHVINESAEAPKVYDVTGGMKWQGKARDFTSADPKVNEYNHRAFRYDLLAPLLYGNYNVDDGLFVGGGFVLQKHGFRKTPYKSRQLFLGSYALNTNSFNFRYDARFTEVVGKLNLEIDVDVKSPNFVNNFFGWGNESVFDRDIDDKPGIDVARPIHYYRLRFKSYDAEMKLSGRLGAWGFIKAGPVFQHVEIEDTNGRDRYIADYAATVPEQIIEKGRDFAGATYSWGFEKLNNPMLITRGIRFQQTSKWMTELSGSNSFASHLASVSFYQSFRLPARVTFALRAGGGINFGDYQLYQAQILDGKTELRGFRKTRFYGDKKIFFNNEVRLKLASVRSYLFPASLGIHGFYDIGRVWYEDDSGIDPTAISGNSSLWHKGFGGGFWFTPFNMTVVALEVGHSVEGTLPYIRLGFLF